MSLTDRVVDVATRPVPLRSLFVRSILRRWPVGSWDARLRAGAVNRPHYAWSMYYAALEAKALGHTAISVVELGVAGGNGLTCLCEHREQIQKSVGIGIEVLGFDTGRGLPSTGDSRDLLYSWPEGSYQMDRQALEKRLAGRAQLVLGNVSETVADWTPRPEAPLGAIMFDLDLYSSTMAAFDLLRKEYVLPRVWCYFDDICGYPEDACTDFIGEREAIREFNADPERARLNDHLSPAYVFKGMAPEAWHQHMYLYHRLGHPQYNTCLTGAKKHQLKLAAA
jgi:hypothetical protein